MFFVFDGIDGAGKSTQVQQFVAWLEDSGHRVVHCQDPGSTALGTRLREILLGRHEIPISMLAEMLLFTTARAQLVQERIKPALADGATVVLDRYLISTVVYQGHAGQLDPGSIREVNRIATEGLQPDATFLLDLPVEIALQRLGASLDRMESRGPEYLGRVRQGFLDEARLDPAHCSVIDANRPAEAIQSEIRERAEPLLGGTP